MKMGRILLMLLIVLAVLGTLSVVSSAPATGEILLNDSIVNVYYSEPQVSTDYAYYYENSGNYAEEAYYAPWSADVNLEIDVNALYKKVSNSNSSYKLEEFKQDLATMIDNGQIGVSNFLIRGVQAKNINDTEISCSLDENSGVLTVSFSYAPDDAYGTKAKTSDDVKSLENADHAVVMIRFGDLDGLDIKNQKSLSNKEFIVKPKVNSQLSE